MQKHQSNTAPDQKPTTSDRKSHQHKKHRGPKLVKTPQTPVENKFAVNNNVIFKKMLYLTSIRSDNDTVIQLFAEQGMTVDSEMIQAWTAAKNSPHYKAMPDEALTVFFDALFTIRKECKGKEINLFDLNKIFDDIREDDQKGDTQAA